MIIDQRKKNKLPEELIEQSVGRYVTNVNSVAMEGFISQEMKSSYIRKSGHSRLFQLAI